MKAHTHTKMKTNEISNKYYAKKEQAKTQNQNEKKTKNNENIIIVILSLYKCLIYIHMYYVCS